jgi:hypothetical protein
VVKAVFVTLRKNARPRFASDTCGVIPVNFGREDDFATTILEATQGRGVDASGAIGFQAKGGAVETVATAIQAETSSGHALRQCIAVTRQTPPIAVMRSRKCLQRPHDALHVAQQVRAAFEVVDHVRSARPCADRLPACSVRHGDVPTHQGAPRRIGADEIAANAPRSPCPPCCDAWTRETCRTLTLN